MGGCKVEGYLHMVPILSFLVDFLLILGTNRISGYPFGVKRASLAALLGGVYAAGCILPGFSFLQNGVWRVVSLGVMAFVAFGFEVTAIRRCAIFVFLSMVLGGVAHYLSNGGFWGTIFSVIGICLLCVWSFPGAPGQRYVPVEIHYGDKEISLTALVDTGNTLRDPVSGCPVLVVDGNVAEVLLGLSQRQIAAPVETMSSGVYMGLRLIPYSAVGQSNGMLLGMRVDKLYICGKEADMILAFAPQRIGNGKNFQALAGGMV